jgi:predicted RNA-binding protein with PUA-like domain
MQYWLLKSEPDSFGIDDLAAAKGKTASWDGVRNYQARNFIRDQMRVDDQALFYHSSCAVPGIAGSVIITRAAYPDHTQFDANHDHYDPLSTAESPRWFVMDVKLQTKFKRLIPLDELRRYQFRQLRDLVILKRGNRLSVTPVTSHQWAFINTLV